MTEAEPEIRCLTFEALSEEWLSELEKSIKISSVGNYRRRLQKHLLPFFGDMRIADITPEAVGDFIDDLSSKNLSSRYISDIISTLKSIAGYISKKYRLPDFAASAELPESNTPKERTGFDQNTQKDICKVITKDIDITKAGILLTMYTGIRIGELCALRWGNIDLKNHTVTVEKTLQRVYLDGRTKVVLMDLKGEAGSRSIPVADFLCDILKEFRSEPCSFFLSGTTKPVEPRTMQYRLASLFKDAGISGVTFNSLREIFMDRCVSLGIDILTLSRLIGNSSVGGAMEHYSRTFSEENAKAVLMSAEKVG